MEPLNDACSLRRLSTSNFSAEVIKEVVGTDVGRLGSSFISSTQEDNKTEANKPNIYSLLIFIQIVYFKI